MTDRELKKLDKSELLQILIEISEENESLRDEIASLREKNESLSVQVKNQPKTVSVQETGSIAEESLRVTGIFEKAQAAADEYLAYVREMNEKKEKDYRRIIEDARLLSENIIKEAEITKEKKIAEADAYWKTMEERFDSLTRDHEWFVKWMKESKGE